MSDWILLVKIYVNVEKKENKQTTCENTIYVVVKLEWVIYLKTTRFESSKTIINK